MKLISRLSFRALLLSLIICCGFSAFATQLPGSSGTWSNVAINGQRLTQVQLQIMELQLGTRIAPGAYLIDNRGCWLNTSTGASGCIDSGISQSRYGSGERTSDGSWNHYSNSAEMGVGGTSDGCIYTTSGWSNC